MKAAPIIAFLLICFLVSVADVYSQGTRTTNAGGRMADFENQRRKADRDSMDREMRGKKPTKEELQNAARIRAETKEDLEGMQQTYNEIVVKLNENVTVPPAFVTEAANKVNKHATRLRANIALPKPEKEEDEKPPDISGDTRKLLRDLCLKIYDFLMDPMIENPQVFDLESAAKVRASLESVIAISGKLKST